MSESCSSKPRSRMSRESKPELGDGIRLVAQDARDESSRVLSSKRPLPAGHLVEQDSKGEDVGPMIHRPSLDLLRRHVGHRIQDHSLPGQLFRLGQELAGHLRGHRGLRHLPLERRVFSAIHLTHAARLVPSSKLDQLNAFEVLRTTVL